MLRQIAPVALIVHGKNLHPALTPPSSSALAAGRQTQNAVPKPIARPAMADFQRARLRAKVAAVTCSEPWTELAAQAAERHGIDPCTTNVSSQLADRGIYPPKPDPGPRRLPRTGAVRMRRCDACGRTVPPINIASHRLVRVCDDCRIQPDSDPDEIADHVDAAPATSAHFDVLVGSLIDKEANSREARRKLHQIGLTDPEITLMALIHAGYSTRRTARLTRWSQSYARKLLRSAARKIRSAGLSVPKPGHDGTSHRPITVDPVKLDAMTQIVTERVP